MRGQVQMLVKEWKKFRNYTSKSKQGLKNSTFRTKSKPISTRRRWNFNQDTSFGSLKNGVFFN